MKANSSFRKSDVMMADQNKQIEKLIEHNDELENYFRNTIIPQLYIDGELKLRKFTPPAMTQFNLTRRDLGKRVNEMKDNLRFPNIEENIQQVIDSHEILEKEIQTTDLRWYQMNIIPYVKKRDHLTDGVIITFVEITTRIKDLKAQEKLIAENAILLDTISHDLNNPLTSLVVAMELFLSTPPNDKKKFAVLHKAASSALGVMQKLISELTEARKKDYTDYSENELLNFEHILEDVRLILSDNINATKARITSNVQVSEITFSRRKLRTVLYNLIYNAVKFKSPQKQPQIAVSTYQEQNYTVISVRDNGIGIEKAQIEKIFSKYHRLNSTVEGSGMGLFLVKEIVNNAGGKIEVDSYPGEGSEFRVYLKTS